MIGPEQSSDFSEYGDDFPREGTRQRGRKKVAATMTRSQKRGTRKRGSSGGASTIVGMGHRRQRRWSW